MPFVSQKAEEQGENSISPRKLLNLAFFVKTLHVTKNKKN